MKKVIAIIAVAIASMSIAHAQFGIVGGFTSSSTEVPKNADGQVDWNAAAESVSLYHVGLTYKLDLGLGLAIQPSLTYEMKGAKLSEALVEGADPSVLGKSIETKTGYGEFGLDLQWGPDLMVVRPFIFASPFVGYMLTQEETNKLTTVGDTELNQEQMNQAVEDAKNRLEYGFGIGAGVDIMKFVQLKAQYYMNLGNLYEEGKIDGAAMTEAVKNNYKDISNYSGIKVSLSILLF